jgi:3-oxoacyl-[acyl-carrier-protein] synthase II
MTMATVHRPSQFPRRVVVTGISVASALGFELDEFWDNLLKGRSGIGRLPFVPEESPLPSRIGGLVSDDDLSTAAKRYQLDDSDRSTQFCLYAVGRALESASLPVDGASSLQYDIIVGTGHGNIIFHHDAFRAFLEKGYRKIRPSAVIRIMFNRPGNVASIRYKLTGASFTVSAACASASIAFGEAFNRIRFGVSDGAIAACCDSGLDLPTFSAWNRLGVLSRNADPKEASRPFDKDRDGLVIGEGAAAFVLEPLEVAQRRGAKIWAEVIGYGCLSDAKHIVQPDAAGQVKALGAALNSAGITAADVDYVNAHGTGTEIADVVEAASLREVFGSHADKVPVSNTKAQLGHLMGATAGVELVTTILAMERGLIPACQNLDNPDPRCPLNFVRSKPLKASIEYALKNSFAFGGTNSVIVLKRI